MANFAYLRVSTDQQDVDNQRFGLNKYCKLNKILNLTFVEDTVSGKKKWQQRKIGNLLSKTMQKGDVLVVAEISRMARSTLQVLEMLELASDRGISVHISKQNLVFTEKGDITSTIMATVLGMVAQIDRELISIRTKEALSARKAAGYELGRPKGKAKTVKLDEKEVEIRDLLEKGVNKRAISKIIECSPSTLYDWMKRRKISIKKP